MKRFLKWMTAAVLIAGLFVPDAKVQAEGNSVVISFAGDCTLGGFKGQTQGNLFSDYYESNGADYFFGGVKDVFLNDDITFVNLEGALTSYPQTAVKKFPIKGEPEYVDILTSGSVEAVGLANNHTYDCGKEGYAECKNLLDKAGILHCGGETACIIEKNGIKVGLCSVNCWTNSKEEQETAKRAMGNLEGCDVICVMFHGGIERQYESNQTTEGFAHFLIDNGADIVIGAHPHVLQGIEKYKGKVIAYSLGNFCFGANKNPSDKDCFILQQEFIKGTAGVTYGQTKVIPCKISSSDEKNDYRPAIQEGAEASRILEKIKSCSAKYPVTCF